MEKSLEAIPVRRSGRLIVNGALPVFVMVKVWVTEPVLTIALRKWVPSSVLGEVSPSLIKRRFPPFLS